MTSQADQDEDFRIVVGIDYGTTFSGCAFGNTSQTSIEHITLIRKWPGQEKREEDKCPSEISYDVASGDYTWGYSIPKSKNRLAWGKLDLDEGNIYENDDDIVDENMVPSSEGMRDNPLDKTPVEVTTDYLTALHNVIMQNFVKAHGETFVKSTAIDWIMTMPAVWSEKAQALTKEAASKAGIGRRPNDRLFTLSEPEAAAVYAISELYRRDASRRSAPDALKIGDNILLCDAGGGTVDLISYKVNQLQPSLGISEAAVGTGGKCGSTFVNRNFETLLHERLGDERFSILSQKKDPTGCPIIRKLFTEFEDIKRGFGESYIPGSEHSLFMPWFDDDEVAGIFDGYFVLSNDDVKSCFDPIVNQVIDLIQGQVNSVYDNGSAIKYIVLVGGFGESDYLLSRIAAHPFKQSGKVNVIRPHSAWSAVTRGAVLRGLEGSGFISDRMCRRSYGTRINTLFDPLVHYEEDAFYSLDTGAKMARNQVSWIVEKGTKTGPDTRFKLKCGTTFQKGEKLRRGATVVSSDLDVAPHSYRDKGVHDLCFLMADLSAIDENDFEEVVANGQKFFTAEFTIEMSFESAAIKFQLFYKDKCYGEVESTFH